MKTSPEKSANEIETLVLKAARGGDMPLGLAEDLSAATAYLDLDRVAVCPCHPGGAATVIPQALDLLIAGHGPQVVTADLAVLTAYAASIQQQTQMTLVWEATPTGAVFHRFEDAPPPVAPKLGRRTIPSKLAGHISEMAKKLLVPETDASRRGGAGAGLTDND